MDIPSVGAAVAGTAGFLNNAISAVKNAREMAKGSSDNELKEQIGAAYDALLDLKELVLNQDDQIRSLKAQLEEKAEYIGPVAPHGYYYAANDTETMQHPFCPTCFQSKPQKLGYMDEPHSWSGGVRRNCRLCGHSVYEVPMGTNKPAPVRQRVSRYGWL